MKWIIILTIIAFVIVVLIILKGLHDASEFEERIEKSLKNMDEEEVFSEFKEENEHSPESIITDDIIKTVSLRNKLNKIANERKMKEFGDFDNREDGR